MFATTKGYLSQISSLDEDPEMTYWDVIELPHQTPWFVVSFVESQIPHSEGELKRRTVLLHTLDHLKRLIRSLKADRAYVEDVQAQIVLPGYMSGHSRWTMEPLAAIMTGLLPEEESEEHDVYETSSGSRFAENMSSASAARLRTVLPRFDISLPQN